MLLPGCPRCIAPVTVADDIWSCDRHGPVPPLWRPAEASYSSFVAHLERAGDFPTYTPWPMGPGWLISDFAVVRDGDRVVATLSCTSGTSALDGPVDVFVVSEEPGTGVGARVARLPGSDPLDVGDGPPVAKARVGRSSVPLWVVSTSVAEGELDRCAVAGEAGGRWLWMVLRPASALLLLRDEWILRDASGLGPQLVEVAFGGPPPGW